MRRAVSLIAGVLGLLMASGCASLAIKRHPEFSTRQQYLRSIAILPPRIEIYKMSFRGDKELMHELLPTTNTIIMDELQTTLSQRGYAIQALETADTTIKQDIYTVDELFDKRLEDYRKRWFTNFKEFRYTLGSAVNTLADHAQSNALLITRCTGYKKTGGEISSDMIKSILIAAATLGNAVVLQAPSVTLIQLGAVDGDTGDILWYVDNANGQGTWNNATAFDAANEKKLRKAVRGLIKNFPKRKNAPPS